MKDPKPTHPRRSVPFEHPTLYGEPLRLYNVRLTVRQADYLRARGNGNLTAGLRALVDAALTEKGTP